VYIEEGRDTSEKEIYIELGGKKIAFDTKKIIEILWNSQQETSKRLDALEKKVDWLYRRAMGARL